MSKDKVQMYHDDTIVRDTVIEIRDSIESYEDYYDVLKFLPTLKASDNLTIAIDCPGGRCDVGFALIKAISSVPCIIKCVVTAPSYSIGALLAMCGDHLVLEEDSYIMFHDFSSGMSGKGEGEGGGGGGDMALYLNNYRAVFIKRFNKLCMPFLSKKESAAMFNGKDIYIHDNDPTLQDRIKRHFR